MKNLLRGSMVYLSGPMECMSDNGTGWREQISPLLFNMGVGVLNPLDKPFVNECVEDPVKGKKLLQDEDYDGVSKYMKEIVRKDLAMVDKSDFVIFHITKQIYTCGTFHEMCVALYERKPCLVYCPEGKQHIPLWLFGIINHKYMFGKIDDLITFLKAVDSGEYVNDKFWHFFDYTKIFK